MKSEKFFSLLRFSKTAQETMKRNKKKNERNSQHNDEDVIFTERIEDSPHWTHRLAELVDITVKK